MSQSYAKNYTDKNTLENTAIYFKTNKKETWYWMFYEDIQIFFKQLIIFVVQYVPLF